jgi:transcriptional regulator with PAS, ATPase and Fis domain
MIFMGPSKIKIDDSKSDKDLEFRNKFKEMIGNSDVFIEILNAIVKIASSDSSVLIFGESGTGKELIARAIHRLSQRSGNKLISINCSAIPLSLMEAELFGYEKGAFTGADRRRIGYLGTANMGSLFLDEIGDMPLGIQSKILRVIQEKRYNSLGNNSDKHCDVRFIAATNKNLEEEIRLKRFRLDLYYRLNVFPIHIPPLRERKEDIEMLINQHLETLKTKNKTTDSCILDKSALKILKEYHWPGNIRQLQNVIERLYLLKPSGHIELKDFPSDIFTIQKKYKTTCDSDILLPEEGVNLNIIIENIENQYITQALQRTGNNKNQASKLLGLNRTTLVEKLKKKGLKLKS